MASDAIDYVSKNVEALAWSDAAENLQQNEALVPAPREQLRQAEVALEDAEQAALFAQSAE